jgi:hypothetical protein
MHREFSYSYQLKILNEKELILFLTHNASLAGSFMASLRLASFEALIMIKELNILISVEDLKGGTHFIYLVDIEIPKENLKHGLKKEAAFLIRNEDKNSNSHSNREDARLLPLNPSSVAR